MVRLDVHVEAVSGGAQLVDRLLEADLDVGVFGDELDEGGPAPRGGEIDLAVGVGDHRRTGELDGEVLDESLGQHHGVVPVGVGLIPLEHRELGVVAGREALVAKHPCDLEDTGEAADDESFQVQLGGNPKEHLLVERIVVGREGPGQRPAGYGVEHRRLDLQELLVLEEAAGERHQPRCAARTCHGRPR